ncbi:MULTISPECIES: universal stress protein [unclassified Streptomyces]|uniref:universal stress protein n=1 Tax=unclassified Streptomyces TaxID=2593676 RepID=UPI0033B09035
MTRTVTVGIDGSPESLAAANWAADEARLRGQPLLLVHVWTDGASPTAYDADARNRQRSAEVLLHEASEQVRLRHPDVRVDVRLSSGPPVEELSAAGDRSELMVLGSRGLSTVRGFVVGSVSFAVLARARRPLVLVRADSDESASASPAGEVVLGLDLPRASREALAFASACADRYGCGLRVVHSWSLPPVYGMGASDVVPTLMRETEKERRRELDAELAPWTAKYPGTPVTRQCCQGHPAQDLVEASSHAGLVVVGLRRRTSELGAHVGPVVHSVLHHAAAPVAVVPHD